jgi:hypothetical protein
MNTPTADLIIQQEAKRLAARKVHIDALKVLVTVIPKVAPQMVETAVDALMEAADEYMAHFPLVDDQGRRSKPGIAEARVSVSELHKSLEAVQKKLSVLPLNAFTELTNAYDAPMGRLQADVALVCKATASALATLKAKPDKSPDHARNVLAYRVAVVFDDILKVKPASTMAKQLTRNMSTGRGGAAYARVLSATLKAAGVASCDTGPLITAGLRLLNDPDLPSRA